MTLDQLLSAPLPSLEALKETWLVFDTDLKDALLSVEHNATVKAIPILLTDSRYALCADLLTETHGAYASTFSHLNPSNFALVDVIDDAAFRELLPTPEP